VNINKESLLAWCHQVIDDSRGDVPDSVLLLLGEAVDSAHDMRSLMRLAEDLAKSCEGLTQFEFDRLDKKLRGQYGYGLRFFLNKTMKKIKTIISRGNIANDAEFRSVEQFIADNGNYFGEAVVESMNKMLVAYQAGK